MLVWCLAAGWLVDAAVATRPPVQSSVAEVVLCGEIPAEKIATHVSRWRSEGVKGVIVRAAPDAGAEAGEAPYFVTEGADGKTLSESVHLLSENGLTANFLMTRLAPDAPYFVDSVVAERTVRAIALTARLSREAGFRGLALDTASSSLFYDCDWDGYNSLLLRPPEIERGAREFGKQITREVAHALPDGEILVIADGVLQSGALWLPLVAGLTEGLPSTTTTSMHLITRELRDEARPGVVQAEFRIISSLLESRLSGKALRRWQERGTVGLAVQLPARIASEESPAQVESGDSGKRDGDSGVRLALAKLLSGKYVVVNTESLATNLPSSSPEGSAPLNVKTPIDAYRRVGIVPFGDVNAFVLYSDEGAALVLSDGLPRSVEVSQRDSPVRVTNLLSGKKLELLPDEQGKAVPGPFAAPTLIERLSVREYVLPAALWFETLTPLTPSKRSVPVIFGFVNRTDFVLDGTLEAVPGGPMAVSPRSQPFHLEPEEAVQIQGNLTGRFSLGEDISLRILVSLPGSQGISRDFSPSVMPDLLWQARLVGRITAAPTSFGLDNHNPRTVVVSEAGEVFCFDRDGKTLWKRYFPTRFSVQPVVAKHWTNTPMVVVGGQRGNVWAMDADGADRWETHVGSGGTVSAIRAAQLDSFPGDELVLARSDGSVTALASNGRTLWTHPSEGGKAYMTIANGEGDGYDQIVSVWDDAPFAAVCIHERGAIRWQTTLPDMPTCPPAVADLNRDGQKEIVVGIQEDPNRNSRILGDGRKEVVVGIQRSGLLLLDASSGSVQNTTSLPVGTTALDVTSADVAAAEGQELLVATNAGIYCLSANGTTLWSAGIPTTGGLVAEKYRERTVILVPGTDGALYGLSSEGDILWNDTYSPVPITGIAAMAGMDGAAGYVCTTWDGAVRALSSGY
ncbi:MAG: PQQ-binding-like beta-propeller repeat protein [Candidatus Hydrogenedentes bacterium]|nr:PQQ-binding-like beta-propeller repeat protein [Candidatus Hydrogenedentota bacterium]